MADARRARSYRLKKRLDLDPSLRLTSRDRDFLSDLSRVGVIDEATASKQHYAANRTGAGSRLERLTRAGILRRLDIIDPSRGQISVYAYASERTARAFGGRATYTGANRTTYHELLVSRAYFDLDRPEDFRIASRFSASEMERFGAHPSVPPQARDSGFHAVAGESAIPDATFTTEDGELVLVEADSGHYTTRQIKQKQTRWADYKQVWVQPVQPHARVSPTEQVTVINY